jgi:hypothetical protein
MKAKFAKKFDNVRSPGVSDNIKELLLFGRIYLSG